MEGSNQHCRAYQHAALSNKKAATGVTSGGFQIFELDGSRNFPLPGNYMVTFSTVIVSPSSLPVIVTL